MAERVTVRVDGRQLTLSNLDKVLYPQTGFTKGELIDYYTRIAPVLLPHVADRPMTVKRYPDGVEAPLFYQKNAPRGTPDWVRTVRLPAPGSTKNREMIDYIVVDGLATLVWLANSAAVELHVPQWRVTAADPAPRTDLIVFDLDPGPPATIEQCSTVALMLREVLQQDGLEPVVKTSGSKGMQLSAAIATDDPEAPSRYAKALAQELERQHPELVVSRMAKALRPGKVFVDWSQNNPAKTTVAAYSLRARPTPTASTPLDWDEVRPGAAPSYTAVEVLERVGTRGDLYAAALSPGVRLPDSPGTYHFGPDTGRRRGRAGGVRT
jgi:bifunctional non-homologous end joining protein LigD